MMTNLDSARPYGVARLSWLLRGEPALSREDIERDAAAQLGLNANEPVTPAPPEAEADVAEADVAEADVAQAEVEEVAEEAAAPKGAPRSRRLAGWLRRSGGAERPEERRARLEREAAAVLGLDDRREQPAA